MRAARLFVLPLLVASPALGATICVDPRGGPCQTTIQAGVNLAGPGDVVQVAAGVYFENVTVPPGKNGLRIAGAGRSATVVDGGRYADVGQTSNDGAFRIESADVRITALGMRNGERAVLSVAPRLVVQDVYVTAVTYGVFFYTNSSGGQVLESEMQMVTVGAMTFDSNDLVIRDNLFRQTVLAADLTGDRALVERNRIEGGAIDVEGDDGIVRQNAVRNTFTGIRVQGTRPRVENNTVDEVGLGIVVACPLPGDPAPPADACTGAVVSGNAITDTLDEAIMAVAREPGLVVEDNKVRRSGLGVTLNGESIRAQANLVSDTARSVEVPCMELTGSDHVAMSNEVARCAGIALLLDGERMRAEENRLANGLTDGIVVNGVNVGPPFADNALVGNEITDNVGFGIFISQAHHTIVTGNTALRNRIDFCDAGTGTVLIGNHFTVVACPP